MTVFKLSNASSTMFGARFLQTMLEKTADGMSANVGTALATELMEVSRAHKCCFDAV